MLYLEYLKFNLVVGRRLLSLITNSCLKIYHGFLPNKEYIIDKLPAKVWRWIYVWINICFFKFSCENVKAVWGT